MNSVCARASSRSSAVTVRAQAGKPAVAPKPVVRVQLGQMAAAAFLTASLFVAPIAMAEQASGCTSIFAGGWCCGLDRSIRACCLSQPPPRGSQPRQPRAPVPWGTSHMRGRRLSGGGRGPTQQISTHLQRVDVPAHRWRSKCCCCSEGP